MIHLSRLDHIRVAQCAQIQNFGIGKGHYKVSDKNDCFVFALLYFLSYSHYFTLFPTTTTSPSLIHTKFSSLNLSQSEVWELPFGVRFVTFSSSNCSCYELFWEGSVPIFKKFNFSTTLLQSSMLLISSFLFSSLISLWKNKFLYNVVNTETYYTLVCIFKPRCICS